MSKKDVYRSINILGYNIFSGTKEQCINKINQMEKLHIISGNPEVLYTGLYDKALFNNFVSNNSLIIPDGVGVQIAGKVLKTPVEEKIAGIELMKEIIKLCEENGDSIYLIGASEENLNLCISNIYRDYPNINISGFHNGFFDLDNAEEIISDIKEKNPKVLFVAMGCPRQENFIIKYMDELPCKIYMGVGGSFDVIAEKVNRAPRWMINIGMEWAYRVAKEPWRIKRLGSIPKFLWIVAKSRGKKNEGK